MKILPQVLKFVKGNLPSNFANINIKERYKMLGIYIHVPFCRKKCPYCDFFSLPPTKSLLDVYTEKILRKLKMWETSLYVPADTLYFGGGTPSVLGAHQISQIIEAAKLLFALNGAEITLEINPNDAKNLDFKALKAAGVNRISLGLQAISDTELSTLGRSHRLNEAKSAIFEAKKSGIENISADLMLAVPEQTLKNVDQSVKFCKESGLQHVSAYILKVEPGTGFYAKRASLPLKTEDEQANFYLYACEALENSGFFQYEISNFSMPGRESRHNLKYWNCEEYLGLGPSAHSFLGGKRLFYPRDLSKFLKGEDPIFEGEGGGEEEYALLRLRLSDGLCGQEFSKRFGKEIPQRYFGNAKNLEKLGLVRLGENSILLTRQGFLLSNRVISQILN